MHEEKRSLGSFIAQMRPRQLGGGYRLFTGSLAYVLHRLTGVALTVYLFLHILSITKAGADPASYDLLMRRYQEPDFKVGEIALYGALLYHALNGFRILLVDFVLTSSHSQKKVFWAIAGLIVFLFIIGVIPLLLHTNVQPILDQGAPVAR